ncbi:peptidoglycan DD-metalloendopeptidase family protein [Chroococcidiopsis sp. CCMEE 29]|uniref:peptidoglycan DD-metalloendopeptidase family protein n=1 Tax=Chroococcidiopsis sp. CCMEE 29 TaxID=155894 RepID=UPI00202000AE|nr:peptidoglycan DD-metalloendopeptidase family protein [Chroococcidiopsis sp. CCMEE 29]
MTQRTDFAHTILSRIWLRSLLVQSLSWIGVFSFLGGNLVLAQEAAIDVIVPTNQDSPPAARLQRLKQKLHSNQTTVKQQQIRTRVASSPALVNSNPVKQKLDPVVVPVKREQARQKINTPPAPQASVPQVRSVVKPQIDLPKPVQVRRTPVVQKTATNSAPDYNGTYIDPTDYKIGATTGYQAPKSVVLSERSTGCKAVARPGLSGSICGSATQRSTRIALRGSQSGNTIKLARSKASSWVRKNQAATKSGIKPIRVGPISVNSTGFHVTSNPAARSVVSYNRTLPSGQPGNANTGLMFPLTIPAPITSLFGWRIHPITGDRRFHTGTDLGAPLGAPVLAAFPGQVAIADFLSGYGLTVVLDHNKFTQQTLYAHLSETFVQPGEWVEQGTVIGRVGSTGNSTGPHLHFETRYLTPEGWVATDPGVQLESALAQLVKALHTARSNPQAGNRS